MRWSGRQVNIASESSLQCLQQQWAASTSRAFTKRGRKTIFIQTPLPLSLRIQQVLEGSLRTKEIGERQDRSICHGSIQEQVLLIYSLLPSLYLNWQLRGHSIFIREPGSALRNHVASRPETELFYWLNSYFPSLFQSSQTTGQVFPISRSPSSALHFMFSSVKLGWNKCTSQGHQKIHIAE